MASRVGKSGGKGAAVKSARSGVTGKTPRLTRKAVLDAKASSAPVKVTAPPAAKASVTRSARKAVKPAGPARKARAAKAAEVVVLSPRKGRRTLSHREIEQAVRRVLQSRLGVDA